MSDNFLRIIPAVPVYVPDSAQRRAAMAMVCRFFPQDQVSESVYERPTFIDCAGNFERILCPHCGSELATERWQEAMDELDRQGRDVELTMPCCARAAMLSGLIYDWPCGVARYEIEVMNPPAEPNRREVASLEQALGCPVRLIWQHV
jgi:hypothetical protein